MKKIVFVCLGNICRPMAEFVMKSLTDQLKIESRATSGWEHGNPIHQGTQAIFKKYAISLIGTRLLSRFRQRILRILTTSSVWMKAMSEI